MGKDRFTKLYALFPPDKPLICIDEHTAVIFYFLDDVILVEGKGSMTVYLHNTSYTFSHGSYRLSSMIQGKKESAEKKETQKAERGEEKKYIEDIPEDVVELLEKRKTAKVQKDFALADTIRKEIEDAGFLIEDKQGEQMLCRKS